MNDNLHAALSKFIDPNTGMVMGTMQDLTEAITDAYPPVKTPLDMVEQFHKVFKHPVADVPSIIAKDRYGFRARVILEELLEFAEACGTDYVQEFSDVVFEATQEAEQLLSNDITPALAVFKHEKLQATLDALCDLQYFVNGLILECGMHKILHEAFAEVHSSNMSKLVLDTDTADATHKKYKEQGVPITIRFVVDPNTGEQYGVVYRDSDNKILKGVNFREPNLFPVLFPSPFEEGTPGQFNIPEDWFKVAKDQVSSDPISGENQDKPTDETPPENRG